MGEPARISLLGQTSLLVKIESKMDALTDRLRIYLFIFFLFIYFFFFLGGGGLAVVVVLSKTFARSQTRCRNNCVSSCDRKYVRPEKIAFEI